MDTDFLTPQELVTEVLKESLSGDPEDYARVLSEDEKRTYRSMKAREARESQAAYAAARKPLWKTLLGVS